MVGTSLQHHRKKQVMGIPEADKVYEGTYGTDNNRVIKQDEEKLFRCSSMPPTSSSGKATTMADISLDLVDLPTFNVATLTALGREVAAKVSSSSMKSKADMGQMILFCDKTSGRVTDCLHDEQNALTDDDMVGQGNGLNRFMHVGHPTSWTVREFYSKLKQLDRNITIIKRVPIEVPSSQENVNRLLDPPIAELMMKPSPGNGKMPDEAGVNQWLLSHENLKPRQVMTNALLFASVDSSRQPSMQVRYRDAFYAGELEGLILLYAYRMVRVIKKMLKSSNTCGRYIALFVDGQAPAIKKLTRLKRQRRQERTDGRKKRMVEKADCEKNTDAVTDMLFHSCERMMLKIPRNIVMSALLDVLRVPLVKLTGARGLYLSQSSFSEAEDDIVRLVSCLLSLETPVKHFMLSELKTLIEHDTSDINNSKKITTWKEIVSAVRKHAVLEKRSVSVNLFSYDFDVLAKWNLMVSHHRQVTAVDSLGVELHHNQMKIAWAG